MNITTMFFKYFCFYSCNNNIDHHDPPITTKEDIYSMDVRITEINNESFSSNITT